MAFEAKDGTKHSMASRMRARNMSVDAKSQTKAPQAILDQPGEPDGDEGMGEAPEQVVAQHGPAVEVHTTHDHENGQHHVHSVHSDGHEHHSDHGSAEEAHEHGKKLASAHEEPEGDDYPEPEE